MNRSARRLAFLAFVALCGCSAVSGRSWTDSRTSERGMPCAEAERVAKGALFRLGYIPDEVVPPQAGAPGRIVGHRNTGWALSDPVPGDEYTAIITIACSNQGAEFTAQTDEPFPGSAKFKSDFPDAVHQIAARRLTRPKIDKEPETGLVISVEPLRPGDASAEFGGDLAASGITPVRIKIDNRTDRTYDFATDGLRLVTQEGERVEPLSDEKLNVAQGKTLREKRIAAGRIAPQGALSGFLYFPASAYRRATLVLIDQETEEEEGFSVEF